VKIKKFTCTGTLFFVYEVKMGIGRHSIARVRNRGEAVK